MSGSLGELTRTCCYNRSYSEIDATETRFYHHPIATPIKYQFYNAELFQNCQNKRWEMLITWGGGNKLAIKGICMQEAKSLDPILLPLNGGVCSMLNNE